MGLAALLCLLPVFTLHLNSFNFQRVNVGVFLGFCRVSEGFPEGFRRFSSSFLGFSQGFLRVSAGFRNILWGVQSFCGFPSFLHGFLQVSAGFRRFRASFWIYRRFSKVSAGLLVICLGGWPGFLFPEILKPQASKSWRKVITVIAQCCAKSYVFVETVFGAINGGNFVLLRSQSSLQFYRKAIPKLGPPDGPNFASGLFARD